MQSSCSELIKNSRQVYFIGIGGAGMSGLARVLHHQGIHVSGSDSKETAVTRQLQLSGIPVFIGQREVHFSEKDTIVYSSAIYSDHVELKAARDRNMKVLHRAEVLSSLLNDARTSIAVAGSHGKTTTSSMISFVLSELGKNPTCLIGGDMLNFKTNAVLGNPDLWVSEVDESDRTHLLYAPNYAVLTNLEEDHMDHYKNFDDLYRSFGTFLSNMHDPGFVVYSFEDLKLSELVADSRLPHASFGFSVEADFSAHNIQYSMRGCEFDLFESGFFATRVRLSVPGRHNIANALATITVLVQLGLSPDEVAGALYQFKGAKRRLEVKFENSDFQLIDDYAHHPTEVSASIRALKNTGKRVTAIFQPHRYSRAKHFFREFAQSLLEADEIILTDIYSAGERNIYDIHIEQIYDEILDADHGNVSMINKSDIIHYLSNKPSLSGIIAFIGAGDIGEVAHEFANRVKDLATA